jgi:hypothetical protein
MTRASERLRNAALEIATVADIGPRELNKYELARIAASILRAADEVELGERSIVICSNCDTDLPKGCGGVFKDQGDACLLNRTGLETKPWRQPESHCQNGGDVCLAGNASGICCPEESCDIDDGMSGRDPRSAQNR